MTEMNLDDAMSTFKEMQAKIKSAEKIIQDSLLDLVNKYSETSEKVELIKKDQIKPLTDQMSQIESEIKSIMSQSELEKFVGDKHGFYSNKDMAFVVKDWDKFFEWMESYEGDFDQHSLLKKDIKNTEMKNFYGVYAECPEGVEMSTFTKISPRKVTKKKK